MNDCFLFLKMCVCVCSGKSMDIKYLYRLVSTWYYLHVIYLWLKQPRTNIIYLCIHVTVHIHVCCLSQFPLWRTILTGAKGDDPSQSCLNKPGDHRRSFFSPWAAVQSDCPYLSAAAQDHTGMLAHMYMYKHMQYWFSNWHVHCVHLFVVVINLMLVFNFYCCKHIVSYVNCQFPLITVSCLIISHAFPSI